MCTHVFLNKLHGNVVGTDTEIADCENLRIRNTCYVDFELFENAKIVFLFAMLICFGNAKIICVSVFICWENAGCIKHQLRNMPGHASCYNI